jgi:hypothetical protein
MAACHYDALIVEIELAKFLSWLSQSWRSIHRKKILSFSLLSGFFFERALLYIFQLDEKQQLLIVLKSM